DEDEDEDDEDEDDEDEDDEPKKAKASSKVVAKSAPAKSSLNKKAAKPITKMPSEIPLPPRNNEIVTGLVVAIGGYIAFWLGWSIYSSSIEQKNVNFFSNSAWAFLVAYFLIAVAATFFVRFERRDPKDEKNKKPKLERQGLLLASLVCGPFYVAYWWKGIELWEKMYAQERPGMWVIFVAFFAFVTFGIGYGLRPPSENEELQRRIPGRRVLLMVMTPFAIVYGMIYLAAFYPPWP
ncbi:MAG TPA: hypothetical protein PKL73_25585, partial [Polyangiaceae bacterium]|nr:hypothetical protein [Polyangiaceae bacterium]